MGILSSGSSHLTWGQCKWLSWGLMMHLVCKVVNVALLGATEIKERNPERQAKHRSVLSFSHSLVSGQSRVSEDPVALTPGRQGRSLLGWGFRICSPEPGLVLDRPEGGGGLWEGAVLGLC